MITIYSKPNCGQCVQLKTFLKVNNVNFKEIILDIGQQKEDNFNYLDVNEFKKLYPDAKSVPQMMVDDVMIGDYKKSIEYLKNEIKPAD